jgi:hypothetical protein
MPSSAGAGSSVSSRNDAWKDMTSERGALRHRATARATFPYLRRSLLDGRLHRVRFEERLGDRAPRQPVEEHPVEQRIEDLFGPVGRCR